MSRMTVNVTIYADEAKLHEGYVSDVSATVHSHHVVHPHPKPVVSGPIDEGGRMLGYEWTVEILADYYPRELYERLADHADRWGRGCEFSIDAGTGTTLSYEAGSRQWFAEQQATRGIEGTVDRIGHVGRCWASRYADGWTVYWLPLGIVGRGCTFETAEAIVNRLNEEVAACAD